MTIDAGLERLSGDGLVRATVGRQQLVQQGKNGGAVFVQPLSTGATFAITEKAPGVR